MTAVVMLGEGGGWVGGREGRRGWGGVGRWGGAAAAAAAAAAVGAGLTLSTSERWKLPCIGMKAVAERTNERKRARRNMVMKGSGLGGSRRRGVAA